MTAGPTREMLDPVRFITNLSTGEMGYAIAKQAKKLGLQVTLISGPTRLMPPQGVRFIPIMTVGDLKRELEKHFFRHDVLVMAAAVGDFIPLQQAERKIPRAKRWTVSFRQSPDLVQGVARKKGNRIVIGFSLETGRWLERSRSKLRKKHLDGIVANYYSKAHNPFGKTHVHVALQDERGVRILRCHSKAELARKLVRWLKALAEARGLKIRTQRSEKSI